MATRSTGVFIPSTCSRVNPNRSALSASHALYCLNPPNLSRSLRNASVRPLPLRVLACSSMMGAPPLVTCESPYIVGWKLTGLAMKSIDSSRLVVSPEPAPESPRG